MKQFESNALQQELARGPAPDAHPDADALTAFAEGTLMTRERTAVMAHLAGCAACRETVSIAAGAAPEAVVAGPHLVARWPGLVARRWAPWVGIAAALMVVSTAVLVRQRTAPPKPAGDELAAAQKEAPVPAPVTASGAPAVPLDKARTAPPASVPLPNPARRKDAPVPAAKPMAATALPVAPPPLALRSHEGDAHPSMAAPPNGQDQLHGELNQVRGANETVSVESNSAQLATEPAEAMDQVVVGANAQSLDKKSAGAAKSTAGYSAGALGGLAAPRALARAAVRPQWRISEDGHAERSFGDGAWVAVLPSEAARMRVVSSIGNDVWVGGEGQRLFHSSDNGTTWTTVALPTAGGSLHAITHIRFTSAQAGTVGSDDGTSWTTTDGGVTWR